MLIHTYIIYDDADKAKRKLGIAGKLQQLLFNTTVGSGCKYLYTWINGKQVGFKRFKIGFAPGAYGQVYTFFGKRCGNGSSDPFGGCSDEGCIHDYGILIQI